MSTLSLTAAQIAKLTGGTTHSDAVVTHVSSLEDTAPGALAFAETPAALQQALQTSAALILTRVGSAEASDARLVFVRDPKYAFALCARELRVENSAPLIHPSAVISPTARLGERVGVGAGAVIEDDVQLGDDCKLGSRATVCRGVWIGARVVVQSGAVLGSTGFGYVRDSKTGEYLLFPQQGQLVIEDDVEIGANTTIDRGALGETRIGRGSKIDNLVHIGHNCSIGRNVVIAAQVGISGSCVIGDGAVLAGQVGLGDHVRVGAGVILGGQGGIFPGKSVQGPGEMFAGTPAQPVRDYLKSLARLRRLK